MPRRQRKKRGLGLLKPGKVPREKRASLSQQEIEAAGADASPPGIVPPPPAPTFEPPAGIERPREEKKTWLAPCFFSCVPPSFRPVDVYKPDGTLLPTPIVPP